jgi:hypothetical protein
MKYYQIENPGTAGFVTHQENEAAHVTNYPGNIWVTENTAWALRVGATEKTKEEAQAILDAIIDEAKAAYDPESNMPEPQYIVLP